MELSLSPEQGHLSDMVRGFLAAHYPFAQRQEAARLGAGWRPETWQAFATDLGLLGIGHCPELGGSGPETGNIEQMIVMEEMGRALCLEPYLDSIVVGASLLAADNGPRAREILGEVIHGRALLAFAWAEPAGRYGLERTSTMAEKSAQGWLLRGAKSMVTSGPLADYLLVLARTGPAGAGKNGLSLFLVDGRADGVLRADYSTIDGRRASDITFANVQLRADAMLGGEGDGYELATAAIDKGVAGICAEAVGLMERAHGDTMAYVAQRHQFKQALGNFQVIQHRLAEMHMHIEMARSAAMLALLRQDADVALRAQAVSAAKVVVGEALQFVGQSAVQLHGGMGMTDELAIGHCFKRLTMIGAEFGTVDHHLARYARQAGAE